MLADELWRTTLNYGTAIWTTASDDQPPDGLKAWQPLKRAAASETIGDGAWSADFRARFGPDGVACARLHELEAREKDGATEKSREDAHFFAQLLRIPLREECSVRRFLQIAFNAGQLKGSGALARWSAEGEVWADLYAGEGLGEPGTYCADLSRVHVPGDLLVRLRALVGGGGGDCGGGGGDDGGDIDGGSSGGGSGGIGGGSSAGGSSSDSGGGGGSSSSSSSSNGPSTNCDASTSPSTIDPLHPTITSTSVLVHCASGRSRSSAIVVAYVAARTGLSVSEALTHIRRRRPLAKPNDHFMRQLEAMEASTLRPLHRELVELAAPCGVLVE